MSVRFSDDYMSLMKLKNMKVPSKLWIFERHNFDVTTKKILQKRNKFEIKGFGQMHDYNFKEHTLKHYS